MSIYPAFVTHPEIRWSDQDLLGHVNNARIITLVEEARIRWMTEAWGRTDLRSMPTVVGRMELNYRVPVQYGPELTVELGIGHVGKTSYTVTCRGIQNGQVCFDGLNLMVMVDPEALRPAPLTDEQRRDLEQYGSFDPENPTAL